MGEAQQAVNNIVHRAVRRETLREVRRTLERLERFNDDEGGGVLPSPTGDWLWREDVLSEIDKLIGD